MRNLPKRPWCDLRVWYLLAPSIVILAIVFKGETKTLSEWSLSGLEQLLRGLGAIKVVEVMLRNRDDKRQKERESVQN